MTSQAGERRFLSRGFLDWMLSDRMHETQVHRRMITSQPIQIDNHAQDLQ
ncbi:MAG: hypothetical protein KDB22_10985 [Planctomycetales bacterium]|nr:hypothetical protein [Planctomycetales bacterium]